MKIANLTQHLPTKEQLEAGVINLDEKHEEIKTLLTFEDIPSKEEMEDRAERLARIVLEEGVFDAAMIGGAPYFMSTLEEVLKRHGIQPLYSFSKRVIIEEKNENNEVVKKSIFKHMGWVKV